MKKNVHVKESSWNEEEKYVEYNDDIISMSCWADGSGHLSVDDINFHDESGTHKSRIYSLKRQRDKINKALKVLEQIEDPKLYLNGTYKANKFKIIRQKVTKITKDRRSE